MIARPIKLLSYQEGARVLGLTVEEIDGLIERHEITPILIDGATYLNAADLISYLGRETIKAHEELERAAADLETALGSTATASDATAGDEWPLLIPDRKVVS